MKYVDMTPAQLQEEYDQVSKTFFELKQKGLKLDMSRGKPGKEQLDAVSDILTILPTRRTAYWTAWTCATTAS